jgi:hypothetical protein
MRTIAEILAILALLYMLGDILYERGYWIGYPLLLVAGVLAWLTLQAWYVVRSVARWALDGLEGRR